jgi:hypothetical protein
MGWSMTFLAKRFLKIGLCVREKTLGNREIVRTMTTRSVRLKMNPMMTGEDDKIGLER